MSSGKEPKAFEDMNAQELWQDTDETMGRAKNTADMALQQAIQGREVEHRPLWMRCSDLGNRRNLTNVCVWSILQAAARTLEQQETNKQKMIQIHTAAVELEGEYAISFGLMFQIIKGVACDTCFQVTTTETAASNSVISTGRFTH